MPERHRGYEARRRAPEAERDSRNSQIVRTLAAPADLERPRLDRKAFPSQDLAVQEIYKGQLRGLSGPALVRRMGIYRANLQKAVREFMTTLTFPEATSEFTRLRIKADEDYIRSLYPNVNMVNYDFHRLLERPGMSIIIQRPEPSNPGEKTDSGSDDPGPEESLLERIRRVEAERGQSPYLGSVKPALRTPPSLDEPLAGRGIGIRRTNQRG